MLKQSTFLLLSLAAVILLAGCGGGSSADSDQLTGTVAVDGSSTVYPVSEAVAEEFLGVHPRVRVTVGVSGTGGGFEKFLAGETDINDASRRIGETEQARAEENNIDYVELPVALDGLSVVVNPANDWVDHLTTAELRRIWQPGSTVENWSDIRPDWPNEPIRLYGPGTASGTFDYFTEVINGESGASRPDYTASENDNVLVQGISGDRNALGFFGYAYFEENREMLKLVPIDDGEGGDGPVRPSPTTINDGTYSPLSRPIFIYVNVDSLARPEVREFVNFYLDNAATLASEVGYIAMPQARYQQARDKVAAAVAGMRDAESGQAEASP